MCMRDENREGGLSSKSLERHRREREGGRRKKKLQIQEFEIPPLSRR